MINNLINNPSATFVDVRSDWEFQSGNIPGSINIPLEDLPFKISEFKKMQGPIVLYCRSGNRSGMATSMLKQQGFQEVYNGGGFLELNELIKAEHV